MLKLLFHTDKSEKVKKNKNNCDHGIAQHASAQNCSYCCHQEPSQNNETVIITDTQPCKLYGCCYLWLCYHTSEDLIAGTKGCGTLQRSKVSEIYLVDT